MKSKAYDNLLEDLETTVFTNGNLTVNGTENIIDGNVSTCLDIRRSYKSTWYLQLDFKTVKSFYEVVLYLDSKYSYYIKLSIYVRNSSFVEAGSRCESDTLYNKSNIVKIKCMDQGRFMELQFSSRTKYPFFICDIIITGCDNGMFGKNCTRNCSENCVGKSCDILNGKCLSGMCSDGWQGEDCNQKCNNGTYGTQCKSHCGNCRDREYCDHVTGYCKGGCEDGSKGDKCDKVCLDGTYGSNCKGKCGKCRGGQSCDKSSGVCLNGCENGYFGEKCILQCPDGTYGYQCNSSCGNCKDMKDCHHVTGYCNGSCADGSMGVKCDKECPFGFYGKDCSERCSISCGSKSEQKSISDETNTCKPTTEGENNVIIYALGTVLIFSLLANIILVAMCIIRFHRKRKDEVYSKPSPMYVNVRDGHRRDNQPLEGMTIDQQNVQYESLGVPSHETHYDALK
ncbi:scavenger receptor class F member 1-like [Saccostrea echinata]|uniref:scavenger receptor class F member 1-like n=1 Tax=Saccostrea echinata TaxID=191078 RepID=UPI002A7F2DB0|nr:scavenger receptor class F member 1-like [Saccostrea echinata]